MKKERKKERKVKYHWFKIENKQTNIYWLLFSQGGDMYL